MIREAGAKKIYVASCAPEVRYAHIYGIDLASPKEMVAYERDNAAMCEELGYDRIIFLTLDALTNAYTEVIRSQNLSEPQSFKVRVFCGQYATPVSPDYFDHLEQIRGKC